MFSRQPPPPRPSAQHYCHGFPFDGISSQRQPRRFPLWWFAAFPLVRKLVEYCEIFDLVLRIWQIVGYNRMVYWNLAECHSFCPDILLH